MFPPESHSAESYQTFIGQVAVKAKELKTNLPAEFLTKSTPAGITALARAGCYCHQDMYTEIFKRVAKAVNDPKDPQPLDPLLVNRIWLEKTAENDQALIGRLQPKTTVLLHLLNEHLVETANPSITCEELHDAIAKRHQEPNCEPTIPTFTHNLIECYAEPPYFFLMAQIQLTQNQRLVNHCLKLLTEINKKQIDKNFYLQHLNKPFAEIPGQTPRQMAELLAEELQ